MFESHTIARLRGIIELSSGGTAPQDDIMEAAGAVVAHSLARSEQGAQGHAVATFLTTALGFGGLSHAQLLQDLWVLHETGFQNGGFFVEFGATDGVNLSNTALLEREFRWSGILAEPNPSYHSALSANRHCFISHCCVTGEGSPDVKFRCTQDGVFSTISEYAQSDGHGATQRLENFTEIMVPSISLDALLRRGKAPKQIDYLSIDTEGSEYEILRTFPFDDWDIRLISVEHNFTPAREQLDDHLVKRGYRRVFQSFSLWDSWYVRRDVN